MTIDKLTGNVHPLDTTNKINEIIDGKQDTLVSGTNIKTINNNSILGSGDLVLDGLPSQTGNTGKFLTTDGTDASWAAVPFRNIGEIVEATIPLTDAGLHLLDGALINESGIYSAFVTYIAGLVSDYPDLFETEANWQSAVSTYGVCGKFVYDSVNNTVRLPKITGIVEGTTDTTALGNLVEAGLPNITGMWRDGEARAVDTSSGAFYGQSVAGRRGDFANATNVTENLNHVFDASRSSSIYGNSNTVQPQTIKVLYYIVIATSTKTDIEVDIDEIATDLNGKADVDLSNVSNTSGFRKLSDIYNNGTSWYKVFDEYNPSTGVYIGKWCEQGGELSASTTTVNYLKIFNNTNYTFVVSARVNGTGNEQTFHSIVMSKGASSITLKIGQYGTAATTSSNYTHCWQASGYIN